MGCCNRSLPEDVAGSLQATQVAGPDRHGLAGLLVLHTLLAAEHAADVSKPYCWQICLLMSACRYGGNALSAQAHSDDVSAVALSMDGHLLASASLDHTVRLWDTTTGDCVGTLAVSYLTYIRCTHHQRCTSPAPACLQLQLHELPSMPRVPRCCGKLAPDDWVPLYRVDILHLSYRRWPQPLRTPTYTHYPVFYAARI